MDKLTQMNLLYDFYGQMLTERQKKFVELYYCHDLSLGEISEQYGVSRQSVYDTLKRSEQTLQRFEKKLGLVAKSLEQREYLARAMAHLNSGRKVDIENARRILSHLMQAEEN
ncbi:MAG: YlxM family DNA-binding protein [Peptococcaceae bacterium]|nr:YlxM family DNA-binding protein [Peptococcaceae bacterium]